MQCITLDGHDHFFDLTLRFLLIVLLYHFLLWLLKQFPPNPQTSLCVWALCKHFCFFHSCSRLLVPWHFYWLLAPLFACYISDWSFCNCALLRYQSLHHDRGYTWNMIPICAHSCPRQNSMMLEIVNWSLIAMPSPLMLNSYRSNVSRFNLRSFHYHVVRLSSTSELSSIAKHEALSFGVYTIGTSGPLGHHFYRDMSCDMSTSLSLWRRLKKTPLFSLDNGHHQQKVWVGQDQQKKEYCVA